MLNEHTGFYDSKFVNLSQHLIHSLHYFGHMPVVDCFSTQFCCCLGRIQNAQFSVSWPTSIIWI
jgi:hypothetical protein